MISSATCGLPARGMTELMLAFSRTKSRLPRSAPAISASSDAVGTTKNHSPCRIGRSSALRERDRAPGERRA